LAVSRGATISRTICSAAARISYGDGGAAKIVADWQPRDVLDLASGSGDLALAMQRQLPEAKIVAADFSPEMLEIARAKGVRKPVLADALQLPFENASFDA